MRNGVDRRLRNEQASYRKGRGTTDQIFILRNIIEQVSEWQATLYLRLVFTSDGVVVGVVIRRVERYDLVKTKPTESEAEH